jgi:hypothetical protein
MPMAILGMATSHMPTQAGHDTFGAGDKRCIMACDSDACRPRAPRRKLNWNPARARQNGESRESTHASRGRTAVACARVRLHCTCLECSAESFLPLGGRCPNAQYQHTLRKFNLWRMLGLSWAFLWHLSLNLTCAVGCCAACAPLVFVLASPHDGCPAQAPCECARSHHVLYRACIPAS